MHRHSCLLGVLVDPLDLATPKKVVVSENPHANYCCDHILVYERDIVDPYLESPVVTIALKLIDEAVNMIIAILTLKKNKSQYTRSRVHQIG